MIALLKLRPYATDRLAPSPNHGTRRAPVIEGIVLHATADGGDERQSLAWLRSPRSRVSCHLFVSRTGLVTRLVGDQQRAWHAGLAWWHGTHDVNSITLGIEIANRNDGEPYTSAQYRRVAAIVAHYCRQGLALDDVVSHAAIAPGRRSDPVGWDWDRFRALVRHHLRSGHHAPRPVPLSRWEPAPMPAPASLPEAVPAPMPESRLLPPAIGVRALRAATAPAPLVISPPARTTVAIARPKLALYSRTLWLNGMMVLAAGAAILGEGLKLAFGVGLVLPEDVTKWALFAVGVVNIILRLKTTQPLTCRTSTQCTPTEVRAPAALPVAGPQSLSVAGAGDVAWRTGSRS